MIMGENKLHGVICLTAISGKIILFNSSFSACFSSCHYLVLFYAVCIFISSIPISISICIICIIYIIYIYTCWPLNIYLYHSFHISISCDFFLALRKKDFPLCSWVSAVIFVRFTLIIMTLSSSCKQCCQLLLFLLFSHSLVSAICHSMQGWFFYFVVFFFWTLILHVLFCLKSLSF